jgi:hypothetical protein
VDPGNIFDRDYYGATVLHPIGLAAVLVFGIAMCLLPRRHAVWPVIAMACFVAPAQRIVVLLAQLHTAADHGAVRVPAGCSRGGIGEV